MMNIAESLAKDGWAMLPFSSSLLEWVEAARPIASKIAADPEQRKAWLRHGATWFAGVNALPNTPTGAVGGGPALPPEMFEMLEKFGLPTALDAGQISVVYPGYPKQDPSESDAAHRYRVQRDAAHVDGLLPIGPDRRRFLREPHAYVLGIPLTQSSQDASPMVVWSGSHHLVRKNFTAQMGDLPSDRWRDVDLTDVYHETRRKIFTTCQRVVVHGEVGAAYLVHRLALHGVAPWGPKAVAPEEGRMIAYFRPDLEKLAAWLAP